MDRKVRLGITRKLFDPDGNLAIPGPGLELHLLRGEIPEALVNRDVLEKPEFRTKFKKFQT